VSEADETVASAERPVAPRPRGKGQSEVAPGSGRSCALHTTAVPDVTMIKTALAGGTVARGIVCAGLSEHRTRVASSTLEFTKGWVGVQPGPRISLPNCRVGIPGEKNDCERTRKQWTAIQTDAADCQTQTTQEISRTKSPALARAGGLCPPDPPRFIAFAPIPESKNRNGTRTAPRLRCWLLARRSGRVSAWPYPPVRSFPF
jgi:hypothetical protein